MTTKQELLDLAERVEGGYAPPYAGTKGGWDIVKALGLDDGAAAEPYPELVYKTLVGSLDAAKALHDVVLPGHTVSMIFDGGMWFVAVGTPGVVEDAIKGAQSDTPGRAWTTEILRAKAEECEE